MWLHELKDVAKHNHNSLHLPLSSPTRPNSPSSSVSLSPTLSWPPAVTPSVSDLSSSASLRHRHRPLLLCPFLPFPRNLLSANANGSLSLFDTNDFVHLKTLPSIHRHTVNDLALQPSGKLTLSVDRDKFLTMANLVRGWRSFCCYLSKEARLMRFDSAVGDRFFIAMEDKVTVNEAEDARLSFELHCQDTRATRKLKLL